MVITLIGKILGLYRDHLMAVHYGTAGMEAKAFYVASRIPRVFFDVVFASAIAACFIPVFSEYLTKKGKQEAFRFGGNFLSVMTLLTALLTGLGILFAEPLVTLFADGYDAQTAALAASLTRVMFPTVLFTGAGARRGGGARGGRRRRGARGGAGSRGPDPGLPARGGGGGGGPRGTRWLGEGAAADASGWGRTCPSVRGGFFLN